VASAFRRKPTYQVEYPEQLRISRISRTVATTETAIDPAQPSRFEKKKNTPGPFARIAPTVSVA
jgi:hypothetical protein